MRVNAINGSMCQTNNKMNARKVSNIHHNLKSDAVNTNNSVAFKGLKGMIFGGATGVAAAGFSALALLNPVGLAAAAAMVVAEVGGAVIGGAIGDAVTGDDDDDE